jgi:glycosyltransferase involved in cell wall biosynthesis
MKLLHCFSSQVRGGAEEYLLTLAKGAIALGWEVHAAFPIAEATAQLRQDFHSQGVTTHPLAVQERLGGRRKLAKSLSAQILRGLQVLNQVKPSVVHLNLPWADYSLGLMLACALVQVPTVVTFHLVPMRFEFSDRLLGLYHWARSRNQQWLSISQFNCEMIHQSFEVPRESLACIYNGTVLDLPSPQQRLHARQQLLEELQLPPQTKLALTVGRLEPQKGYGDLTTCIPQILQEFPEVRFVWVGDGTERARLEQELERLGVGDRVHLLGYRRDVSQLLRAADLFVFPTHFEGHPLAILEAMNAGAPIVTSDASGIPEVIHHGLHGLVFAKGDPAALLESLQWALARPEAMGRMAQLARLRVGDFSQDGMIRQTLELFERVSQGQGLTVHSCALAAT